MAKFAVGEVALLLDCYRGPEVHCSDESPVGHDVVIAGIGPYKWQIAIPGMPPADYMIEYKGKRFGALESWLQKRPPTEDPGLTRIKKLLEQDTKPKQPITTKETQS